MIINDYTIQDYLDPFKTYERLSDKLKIGHLIYSNKLKKIVKVTPKVLTEIFEKEEKSEKKDYCLIILNENWLTKIFNFKSFYLSTQYMTVYTSNFHGLKVHEQNNRFYLGYGFKEKINKIPGMSGMSNYKPNLFFVNELMDYLFLIKKEQYRFSENDLQKINEEIGKNKIELL